MNLDIDLLIHQVEKVKDNVEVVEGKLKADQEMFEVYMEKMKKYKMQTEDAEKDMLIHATLRQLRDKVESLTAQSMFYASPSALYQ